MSIQILFLTTLCAPVHAETKLGQHTSIVFATVEQAKEILTSGDDFIQRMSPFDRASRLQTDRKVSVRKYLKYVGDQVLAWEPDETRKIESAIAGVQAQLDAMSLPFGDTVYIIKTTGQEEGGAAYTRANAIVFPERELTQPARMIQKIFCHELFHIMSRANPPLREELYGAIGFSKCHEVAFPRSLKARKITNPDAPKNDHCIRLTIEGEQKWAVPILFATSKKYDVKRGGPFFSYIQFKWLVVERDGETVIPVLEGTKPKLMDMQQTTGFFEQVGRNTEYIIHPEEILADNFAMLVTQDRKVSSPEILEKIARILNGKAASTPAKTNATKD